MNYYVTDHALRRWRERVAAYGDAPKSEVAEELRRATPLRERRDLPFAWLEGSRYYQMAGRPRVYFVTDMRDDGEAVVTVIDLDYRPPVLTSGRRKKPRPAPDAPVADAGGTALLDEPDFPSAAELREWLVSQQIEAQAALSALAKSDPDRDQWVKRHTDVTMRLKEIKDEYRKERWSRDQEESARVIRADGSINPAAAARFLLAEVARLAAEVAALKAERGRV